MSLIVEKTSKRKDPEEIGLPKAQRQRLQPDRSDGEDVSRTRNRMEKAKVFNDPVHGHIVLDPLMVMFIDTPQFQRLRYIKQLGGGYYVFPGASHNRFEHSIGVGYLAGELVETLQRNQAELKIYDKDVLCVKLAGLCHDLGHGPFSHLFDKKFIPKVLPDRESEWKHEEASVKMLDHLIDKNCLMDEMKKCGLNDNDREFIKELIIGSTKKPSTTEKSSRPDVRRQSMSFLYEIVANTRTEIDVDKMDYFARDCHHLGIPNGFDLRRYMKFVRVIRVDQTLQGELVSKEPQELQGVLNVKKVCENQQGELLWGELQLQGEINEPAVNWEMQGELVQGKLHGEFRGNLFGGQLQICARDKEAANLYEMFHTRITLHRKAYQHKTTQIIEHMIMEALVAANDHIKIPGEDSDKKKTMRTMSEAIDDPVAYTKLTDQVWQQIQLSDDPALQKAKDILEKIEKRELYKYVGQTQVPKKMEDMDPSVICEEMIKCQLNGVPELSKDDIVILIAKFDYGMGDDNPMDQMHFYTKRFPDKVHKIRKDQVSQMLPHIFSEKQIRVFCKKDDDPSLAAAWKYFSKWCSEKKCIPPTGPGEMDGSYPVNLKLTIRSS